MQRSPLLIAVVGPTAVGKTDLCVRLARRLGAPVLSADSRQFYREMRIGTAKPSMEEQGGVPHYFIDSRSVAEHYSVGDFEREALSLLEDLFRRHRAVVLTGGSGLFVQAVCEGIDDIPPLGEGVRERLMEEFAEAGLAPLLAELEASDPDYFREVDRANHARVIRALEVIRSSGQPFSRFRKREAAPRPFGILKIGLQRDRAELYARIDRRVEGMVAAGLEEEARGLWPLAHLNALQTVGYQEFFDYFDGKMGRDEAISKLQQHTRRYAKRQLTWFKRDAGVRWFHPDDWEGIWGLVEASLPT
jgi:tRNA dimethylallyltransferase